MKLALFRCYGTPVSIGIAILSFYTFMENDVGDRFCRALMVFALSDVASLAYM